MEKISYALGLSMGNNFRASGIQEINVDEFMAGLRDVFGDKEPKISYDDAKNILNEYFQKLQEERFMLNEKAGKEFLSINKNKEGVIELPSGLQYQVLVKGNGPKPTTADSVKCHYQGSTIDGQIFDSSIQRGEPAVFGVTQVIPGWVEALQLMETGSKWRLFIPSNLAYGASGAGEAIEPFSTLIFDVELLEIVK